MNFHFSCRACAELEQESHFSEISASEIRCVHSSDFVLIAFMFWKKARVLQKEAHPFIVLNMVHTWSDIISSENQVSLFRVHS